MKTWQDLIELSKRNAENKKAKNDLLNSSQSNADRARNKLPSEQSVIVKKSAPAKSIHDGHRSRMRERFQNDQELEGFAEHEVLELLLFNSVCRKDTNALAHRLINEFGSIVDVMDASFDSLKKAGLNDASIVQIKQVLAVSNYYLRSKFKRCVYLKNVVDVAAYFGTYFANRNHECVYVAFLDAESKILNAINIGKGGATSTDIDTYKLISSASSTGAVKVLLMHNHPSGNLLPSSADIATTGNLMVMLTIIGATLMDHIVFGSSGNYFSFHDNGLMSALGDRCYTFIGCENRSKYICDNAKLVYGGKGKRLNLKSYETLERQVLDDIENFGVEDFSELAKSINCDPKIGNYLKNL